MGSMPRNCPLNGQKSRFWPFLRAACAFSAPRVRARWVPRANALHRKPVAPPWRVHMLNIHRWNMELRNIGLIIYQYQISGHMKACSCRILHVSSSANANAKLHVTDYTYHVANPIKCDLCIHRIIVIAHRVAESKITRLNFSLPLIVT